MQTCSACQWMMYPPKEKCTKCNSAEHLEWRPVSGRGRISGYAVQHDSRISSLKEDQPFNIAIIQLEEDPGIQMFSHLPGTPAGKVPVGAAVKLEFEVTAATGQKVPEWRVV